MMTSDQKSVLLVKKRIIKMLCVSYEDACSKELLHMDIGAIGPSGELGWRSLQSSLGPE